MELVSHFWLGELKTFQDFNSSVSGLTIVLRCISLETRSVPPVEVLEHNTDGVASLPDADGFQHTCTSQLFEYINAVKVVGSELVVWFDASDVPWAGFPKSDD